VLDPFVAPTPTSRIIAARPRTRCVVGGHVITQATKCRHDAVEFDVTLTDGTGQLLLAFLGRRRIHGFKPGREATAAGTVVMNDIPTMLNPQYWLHIDNGERARG
jgi:hypothetical protein